MLSIQVFLTGWQLPPRYLRTHWRSLLVALGPNMVIMWLVSALLVWGLAIDISFLYALIVASSITPTDPVLANTIIKGRFADENVPAPLANLIAAESGANDGLGFPFLYLGLFILKGQLSDNFSVGKGIGFWFADTWVYVVLLSVVWGMIYGYVGRKALKLMDHLRYVEREGFHGFAIFLALALVGTCGLVGSDDILACFVAGNVMSWDDWFRRETIDDSFQPTMDLMLNQAIFLWFGAAAPWQEFGRVAEVITAGRLVALGVLILLLRRVPSVLLLHKLIPQIPNWKFAAFMGYFGPIGVSAIFYLYETLEFLDNDLPGISAEDAVDVQRLRDLATVVVWFMVISSTIAHGLTIPLAQSCRYLVHLYQTRDKPDTRYTARRWSVQEAENWRRGWWFAFKKQGEHPPDGVEPVSPRVHFRRLRVHHHHHRHDHHAEEEEKG